MCAEGDKGCSISKLKDSTSVPELCNCERGRMLFRGSPVGMQCMQGDRWAKVLVNSCKGVRTCYIPRALNGGRGRAKKRGRERQREQEGAEDQRYCLRSSLSDSNAASYATSLSTASENFDSSLKVHGRWLCDSRERAPKLQTATAHDEKICGSFFTSP